MAGPPHLEDVLANVCRGRVAYLVLTRKQKRALHDPDGRIALDVLRHLLGARPMVPERFPLTEQAFQAVARRLGYVGSSSSSATSARAPRRAEARARSPAASATLALTFRPPGRKLESEEDESDARQATRHDRKNQPEPVDTVQQRRGCQSDSGELGTVLRRATRERRRRRFGR